MKNSKVIYVFVLFIVFTVKSIFCSDLPVSISLSSPYQPTPGGIAIIDVTMDQNFPAEFLDIDGFQLMISYDSSKFTLWDVHAPMLSDSCNWKVIFMNIYSNIIPQEYLWIEAAALYGNSKQGEECLKFGEPALSLEFLVSDNISLQGDTSEVEFMWLSCEDNRMWKIDNDTFNVASVIYNSDGVDITDQFRTFPTSTGPGYDCVNDPGDGDTVYNKNLKFYSARIIFQSTTDISNEVVNLPDAFRLEQNYPNPFNPSTNIDFYLPIKAHWKMEITNITGQNIRSYEGYDLGKIQIDWDGENENHQAVSSGIYFYKITTESFSDTKKMILLR